MFSGIGGFELGIRKATNDTWKCVGFSEIDKYAIETYRKHFPEHKNYGNATSINAEELPDFDILCGGFPCQAFSIAGKRKGFEDTRGTLFFEVARIAAIKKPKIVFLENVKGLLNHDRGNTFAKIIQTLGELGYDVQWCVLNSKNFGVPQNRERVFIIGHLRGTSGRKIFPIRYRHKEINDTKSKEKSVYALSASYAKGGRGAMIKVGGGDGQGNRVYDSRGIACTLQGLSGGQGAKTGLYAVLTPDRMNKRQNGRRFKDEGEPMFTLTGQDIHGIMVHSLYPRSSKTKKGGTGHLTKKDGNTYCLDTGNMQAIEKDYQIRRLTPIECERLQGFPDNWTVGSDTQRYKQLGNAVTVNVIQAIVEELI